MKKQYIAPDTTRYEVELQQMIAESTTVNINREETVSDENQVESRRSFSIWDDEDEFDSEE